MILVTALVIGVFGAVFYAIPIGMTFEDDYPEKMKYKYFVRFFDFYLTAMPAMLIGASLGFSLIFIVPSLIIAPINLFFDVTFLDANEVNFVNACAIYYYLAIAYKVLREKVIYTEYNIL